MDKKRVLITLICNCFIFSDRTDRTSMISSHQLLQHYFEVDKHCRSVSHYVYEGKKPIPTVLIKTTLFQKIIFDLFVDLIKIIYTLLNLTGKISSTTFLYLPL